MNQPTRKTYCAYRDAAGIITITRPTGTTTEPTCLSCATEALNYYRNRPRRSVTFTRD